MALNRAVFLDKDGTLVHDVPYNTDPEHIRLRDGAGPALSLLKRRGYRLIVVSNQPGIARGLFDETALAAVWDTLARLLDRHDVLLDGIYYCPHHPQGIDPRYTRVCDCRKPQAGLLRLAASEHHLDLERSWIIGDILDDVEAGRRAGCRTVLLDVGSETEWRTGPNRQPHFIAASLIEAAHHITHPAPALEARWTA